MATEKKNINDYYTIKKRIICDKFLNKVPQTDCFKVPDTPVLTNSLKKKVVASKQVVKNKNSDSIDIRNAFKKPESSEKLNQSDQNETRTPKRKEISPIFGDTVKLTDSKKKKTLLEKEQVIQETCQSLDLIVEKNNAYLKSKVRKKIFEVDTKLQNDLKNKDFVKTESINNDLKSPFFPLSLLALSPSKSDPKVSSLQTSQKLSLEQVKSRLINCSKLSELKQQLVSINDCANKLIEFQKKTLSPVKIDIESNSPSKSVQSPVHCRLSSPKKILEANDENFKAAGFIKTNDILKLNEHGLYLPIKFQVLYELFNSLDIVVAMLFNRRERCSFDKVKTSVQKMVRKNFDIKKFATIATVYPEAYSFEVDNWIKKEQYQKDCQIIIIPKIDSERMLPNHLSERKEKFYNKLLDIVKDHHKQFLSALQPPIIINNASLRRWHPRFKLHDIPDIEINSSILTIIPKQSENNSKNSVENFLFHSRTKLALDVQTNPDLPPDKPKNKTISDKITSGLLKGVSKDLLDKVRAKEAASMVKALTRNPMTEKKLSMIKQLPDLIKIIHNYFIGESKAAQVMEEVIKKCIESYYTFISIADVKNQIILLTELLPDWIYILNVRKGVYIKIDKQKNLNELFLRLEKASSQIKA